MSIYLNTISPAPGSKKQARRVGRGIGSGRGKTCGKGHKGQRARAGGYHKLGFEGGQTPLQRRLPKFGFKSKKLPLTAEIRLSELNKFQGPSVSLHTLLDENFISSKIRFIKIIFTGKLLKPLIIDSSILMTKRAAEAILKAGGTIKQQSTLQPTESVKDDV